jgi:hypothetical protein
VLLEPPEYGLNAERGNLAIGCALHTQKYKAASATVLNILASSTSNQSTYTPARHFLTKTKRGVAMIGCRKKQGKPSKQHQLDLGSLTVALDPGSSDRSLTPNNPSTPHSTLFLKFGSEYSSFVESVANIGSCGAYNGHKSVYIDTESTSVLQW